MNSLWRTAMSLDTPCQEWMPLALRMMLLCTMHQEEVAAGWVRSQVVDIIKMHSFMTDSVYVDN